MKNFKPYNIIVPIDSEEKHILIEDLKKKAGLDKAGQLCAKAFAVYEAYLDGILVEKEKQQ